MPQNRWFFWSVLSIYNIIKRFNQPLMNLTTQGTHIHHGQG
jgi:hypothetical protein